MSVLDALHVVVIGMGMDSRRQERARRQCLTRMLWEMSASDVHQAWLDARTPSQNAKDIALVDILRVRGELADELRVDFGYPRTEPLLWLPDIVAGAVGIARGDGDEQYLTPLAPLLTEHVIKLD